MVFNKNFIKKKKVRLKEASTEDKPEWWERVFTLWVQEARAVSLWSCVAMTLRIVIGMMLDLAAYRDTNELPKYVWRFMIGRPEDLSGAQQEIMTTASVLCGWIVSLLPSKLITNQAPGFIFGNPL